MQFGSHAFTIQMKAKGKMHAFWYYWLGNDRKTKTGVRQNTKSHSISENSKSKMHAFFLCDRTTKQQSAKLKNLKTTRIQNKHLLEMHAFSYLGRT